MKRNLPSDLDDDLDRDPVWNLVDQASTIEPSPTFTQDTLRRARLESSGKERWWQKFVSPLGLLGASSAALAVLALLFTLNSQPAASNPEIVKQTEPSQEWTELEDVLASELLVDASTDPSLFSDAELVSLLF